MVLHHRRVGIRLAEIRSLHRWPIRVLSADGSHGLQVPVRIDLVESSRVLLVVSLRLDVRNALADVASYARRRCSVGVDLLLLHELHLLVLRAANRVQPAWRLAVVLIGSVVPIVHVGATLLNFITLALFFWWRHRRQMDLVRVINVDLVFVSVGNAHML